MQENETRIATQRGLELVIRAVGAEDRDILDELFQHVSREDLRFRFLTGLNEVGENQLQAMIPGQDSNKQSFVAFAAPEGVAVATAMLAWDPAGERGEVAISVRADHRGRGIGWTLLSYMADQAEERGLTRIESVESRANHAAIELEREMGFTVEPYPDDATLVIVSKQLGAMTAD